MWTRDSWEGVWVAKGGNEFGDFLFPFNTGKLRAFYFYLPEDNSLEKKIHNTDTKKKSEHVMSNCFKKPISKSKANLFYF